MNTSQLLEAIRFASFAHGKQSRKAAKRDFIPYLVHPLEVCQILEDNVPSLNVRDGGQSSKSRDEMLIAAILHDVLEDCADKVTEADIRNKFGVNVLGIVKELTDDKALAWDDRKRMQIENGPKKSRSAKRIKVADKISNNLDLVRIPPPNWEVERIEKYALWSRDVVNAMNHDNSIDAPLIALFWKATQDVIDWAAEQKIKSSPKKLEEGSVS